MRFSLLVQAALASASTLTPGVVPLIVRNPYLSTWMQSRASPWERWPIFWTGDTVGFAVMASVPDSGKVYPLLGRVQDFLRGSHYDLNIIYPEYLGATFDASTTNLTYLLAAPSSLDESPAKLTLSFLSPLTPSSTLRQSLPAAYLTIFVEGSFDVDVYVDINGEWISGKRESQIVWELQDLKSNVKSDAKIKTWKISRETQQLLTESRDRAEWGSLYFSGPEDVRYQSGTVTVVRQHFAAKGHLKNEVDSHFRGIFQEEPVFAFSKSFKFGSGNTTTKSADSVMFTFGLVQDPVVQFASARGLTLMKPFWSTYFPDPEQMIKYHYDDFKAASSLAQNYSDQLAVDAYASGSSEYQEIAALSARQVLGATQFSGTPDNPILFLKEISSNGNFQTVDVIFPAFPFFLYTNPRWLAYLLEPLLEHQLSGQYPNDYSMHDLGLHFPNATGHADGRDEYMPLEECGNMLIMGLALVNAFKYDTQPAFVNDKADGLAQELSMSASGLVDEFGMDRGWGSSEEIGVTGEKEATKWVAKSYSLWTKWTGYLVRESLIPRNQLSTDDFAGWLAYQTNLALKGIIGIKAMSEIAELLHRKDDATYYRNISDTYITKWQEYGLSRDKTHAKLAYDWYGSWTTLYNLYADSLLCFHLPEDSKPALRSSAKWRPGQRPISDDDELSGGAKSHFVPDEIYQMQSDWYHAVMQQYGLPLDSRHLYTKSDWEFFAAAVTGKTTRQELLTAVAKWVNETTTDKPFTDLYNTEGDGGYPGLQFKARPVVGGHFAFLALERACGGKAVAGLSFLDEKEPAAIDIEAVLAIDQEVELGEL